MDKHYFLKKLRKGLLFTFNRKEIKDILSDYEDFFTSGANDGKSEEEICTELGDPNAVALELTTEFQKKPISFFKDIFPKISYIALTIFFVILYYFTSSDYFDNGMLLHFNFVLDNIVLFVAFAFILWVMFSLKRKKTPQISYKVRKIHILILSVMNIILILIPIMWYNLLKQILMASISNTPNMVIKWFNLATVEQVGEFIAKIIYISIFVSFLIACISVYSFYRSTPFYFATIVHSVGAANCINGVRYILGNIENIDTFNRLMQLPLKIYIGSIVQAALFVLIIYILSRRAK